MHEAAAALQMRAQCRVRPWGDPRRSAARTKGSACCALCAPADSPQQLRDHVRDDGLTWAVACRSRSSSSPAAALQHLPTQTAHLGPAAGLQLSQSQQRTWSWTSPRMCSQQPVPRQRTVRTAPAARCPTAMHPRQARLWLPQTQPQTLIRKQPTQPPRQRQCRRRSRQRTPARQPLQS